MLFRNVGNNLQIHMVSYPRDLNLQVRFREFWFIFFTSQPCGSGLYCRRFKKICSLRHHAWSNWVGREKCLYCYWPLIYIRSIWRAICEIVDHRCYWYRLGTTLCHHARWSKKQPTCTTPFVLTDLDSEDEGSKYSETSATNKHWKCRNYKPESPLTINNAEGEKTTKIPLQNV